MCLSQEGQTDIGRADIDIKSKSMKTLEPQKQDNMTAKQIWHQTQNLSI